MPRDRRHGAHNLAGATATMILCATLAHAETINACHSTPAPIPDDATTLIVPISVASTGTIAGLEVELTITHPWIGDLVVSLTDGTTTALLMSRTALGTYPFACGGDDVDATFSDDATVTPADLCSPTTVPNITGLVLPVDALSAFAAAAADSPWEIHITDQAAFDSGTLVEACLTITLAPPTDCVADLDDDNDTDVFDFAIFAANFGQAVTPGTGGDYDSSGTVDVFDFSVLAGDFGCLIP